MSRTPFIDPHGDHRSQIPMSLRDTYAPTGVRTVTASRYEWVRISLLYTPIPLLGFSILMTVLQADAINPSTPRNSFNTPSLIATYIYAVIAILAAYYAYCLGVLARTPGPRFTRTEAACYCLSYLTFCHLLVAFPLMCAIAGTLLITGAPPCPPHHVDNDPVIAQSNDDFLHPCEGKYDIIAGWAMLGPVFTLLGYCVLFAAYRVYQHCCKGNQDNARGPTLVIR